MEIKKFGEYLKEDIALLVLDVVIDDDGVVYNGEDGTGLIKGNIERARIDDKIERTSIMGSDRKSYPAGIDKNGNLVAIKEIDGVAYASDGITPLPLPGGKSFSKIRKECKMIGSKPVWTLGQDYYSLIPILPTGWVNVKLDMEVCKKVRRYSKRLGRGSAHDSFMSKLSELDTIGDVKLDSRRGKTGIQKKMSIIILLHYINELKDFFTPSSSGFLFESFLTGLIPNARVVDNNGASDIEADGKKYQIKLLDHLFPDADPCYRKDGSSKMFFPVELDYYVIGLKYADRIEIYILDGKDENQPNYFGNFLTPGGKDGKRKIRGIGTRGGKGYLSLDYAPYRYSINLLEIDNRIDSIAKDLRNTLGSLYENLSKFQYNVETIITGVNEKGNIISGEEFARNSSDAAKNIIEMDRELESLIGIIGK